LVAAGFFAVAVFAVAVFAVAVLAVEILAVEVLAAAGFAATGLFTGVLVTAAFSGVGAVFFAGGVTGVAGAFWGSGGLLTGAPCQTAQETIFARGVFLAR